MRKLARFIEAELGIHSDEMWYDVTPLALETSTQKPWGFFRAEGGLASEMLSSSSNEAKSFDGLPPYASNKISENKQEEIK